MTWHWPWARRRRADPPARDTDLAAAVDAQREKLVEAEWRATQTNRLTDAAKEQARRHGEHAKRNQLGEAMRVAFGGRT